jgi:hypothetical protein
MIDSDGRAELSNDQVDEYIQGDVVKFINSKGKLSVAVVDSFDEDGDPILIRLVKREGLGNECYLDESEPKLKVKRGACFWVNAYPSQRVAWSSASPHFNPHGRFLLCVCVSFHILLTTYVQVKKVKIAGSLILISKMTLKFL